MQAIKWAEGKTIGLLVAGLVLFCASLVNFIWTGRNAIVDPRLLKNRTTVVWLICGTLHASSFLSACFYFPVFFQGVEGADPLMSGVSHSGQCHPVSVRKMRDVSLTSFELQPRSTFSPLPSWSPLVRVSRALSICSVPLSRAWWAYHL